MRNRPCARWGRSLSEGGLSHLGPLGSFPHAEAEAALAAHHSGRFGPLAVEILGVDDGAVLQVVDAHHLPLLRAAATRDGAGPPVSSHPPAGGKRGFTFETRRSSEGAASSMQFHRVQSRAILKVVRVIIALCWYKHDRKQKDCSLILISHSSHIPPLSQQELPLVLFISLKSLAVATQFSPQFIFKNVLKISCTCTENI